MQNIPNLILPPSGYSTSSPMYLVQLHWRYIFVWADWYLQEGSMHRAYRKLGVLYTAEKSWCRCFWRGGLEGISIHGVYDSGGILWADLMMEKKQRLRRTTRLWTDTAERTIPMPFFYALHIPASSIIVTFIWLVWWYTCLCFEYSSTAFSDSRVIYSIISDGDKL